jgi:hypothetical protein
VTMATALQNIIKSMMEKLREAWSGCEIALEDYNDESMMLFAHSTVISVGGTGIVEISRSNFRAWSGRKNEYYIFLKPFLEGLGLKEMT